MTDITNYRTDELTALFMCVFDEASAPAMDPDDNSKLSVQPIYKTGIGLDTESTTITHQEVYGKKKKKKVTLVDHCFCYTYQLAVGTQYYAVYRLPQQLFTFLDTLIDTLNYLNMGCDYPAKCIIWVANLGHEFSFIKYKIMQLLECKKMFAKSPRECLYLNFDVVEMRECLGLFGRSLDDISGKWCHTKKLKGDLDYDKIRISTKDYCTPLNEDEMQYCINDVIILTEMHEKVYETYKQENGCLVMPYTRSGFVRTKLKNSIREDPSITKKRETYNERCDPKYIKKNNIEYLKMCNKHKFVDQAQWSLCREYGYSGGLCGSNIDHVGKTLKNVMMADLTSDYPAVMLHKKYPAGWLHEVPLSEYTTIREKKKQPFFILAIVDFKSFSHHATFSKHKVINYDDKLFQMKWGPPKEMIAYNGKILQARNCYVVLNDVDIEAYEMIYEMKITPLKMWAFDRYSKLPGWIQRPIKEDYIIKATLKHTPAEETQQYKDAKININTYYGVTATKTHDVLNAFAMEFDPEKPREQGTFKPERHRTFRQMTWETWLDPYIAFWTTSYARKILMYFISKYPDAIVQYDTDSLFYLPCKELENELNEYNSRVESINKRIFKDHPQKELMYDLGCWDFDKRYDQFLAMGAKKYIKQQGDKITPVIAGLPKGAIPAEIKAKNIKKPLEHYNVTRWVKANYTKPELIIKHMFTHKFASVYDDRDTEYKVSITDCCGVTGEQICGCYHAIIPIDFTLSMARDYIKQVFNVQHRNW